MLQWVIRLPEFAETTEFNERSTAFGKSSNEFTEFSEFYKSNDA